MKSGQQRDVSSELPEFPYFTEKEVESNFRSKNGILEALSSCSNHDYRAKSLFSRGEKKENEIILYLNESFTLLLKIKFQLAKHSFI